MLYQCFSVYEKKYGTFLIDQVIQKKLSLSRVQWYYTPQFSLEVLVAIIVQLVPKDPAERQTNYAAIGGEIVVSCLAAIWRKNIVSSLSQMVGAFILISTGASLFDAKRKITSSTFNEFSLIILRRSNLGVCSNSIFLGRVNSMRLGLMYALKSLLLCSSRCSLYRTV
jgi:hypothetical protein